MVYSEGGITGGRRKPMLGWEALTAITAGS